MRFKSTEGSLVFKRRVIVSAYPTERNIGVKTVYTVMPNMQSHY